MILNKFFDIHLYIISDKNCHFLSFVSLCVKNCHLQKRIDNDKRYKIADKR